tara:strand:- start:43403 stop:44386 length:984 start_codon:yes stop_codon:yes gene_type:complete
MIDFHSLGAILSLPGKKFLYLRLQEAKDLTEHALSLYSFNTKKAHHYQVIRAEELTSFPTESPLSIHWQKAKKSHFEEDFHYFHNNILSGKMEKAVPYAVCSSQENVDYENSLSYVVAKFLKNYSGAHFYAFWDPKNHYFIAGESPEILFERQGQSISTHALAATNHQNKNSDLLQDAKEQKEHAYVVKDLTNRLQQVGKVDIADTKTTKAGNLEHLSTNITCQLRSEISSEELVHLLHPSPALGTYPREALPIMIERYPDTDRHFFGCPILYRRQDYSKAIVAIRNLQFFEQQLHLFTGCGIVQESELNSEWQEILAKQEAVLDKI